MDGSGAEDWTRVGCRRLDGIGAVLGLIGGFLVFGVGVVWCCFWYLLVEVGFGVWVGG